MAEAGQRLGQLLMKAGVITDGQLNDALEVHKATGSPLGRVLVELGYATQGAILSVMAQQIGIPYVDFSERKPDPTAVAVVPKDLAIRYVLMPVGFDEQNRLVVAMADPQNVLALDDLRIITGYEIRPAISTKDDILAAIEESYKVAEHVDTDAIGRRRRGARPRTTSTALSEVTADAPIVKLVNFIITKAVADRASDIHIEPQERDLRVRYRIDGVLHEMMRSPKTTQAAIISRFKIMADMDIAETRKPQDGHCALTISGHKLDFRVSTLPTVYGERVVLRILRKDSILLRLSDLGFLPGSLERFESSFRKPYGAILVTGPTGSGKSTSLYAAINVLNSPDRHIITAEDPVEYRLPGVNQVQTNPKAGLTFAARAALVPALLARRHPRRRDPRPGDRQDRDRVGADRPPRALDAAHERRAERGHAPRRDGRRAVPRVLRRRLRSRASASRAGCARTARRSTFRRSSCFSTRATREDNLPDKLMRAEGLQEVRRHGLSWPHGGPRGHADDRGDLASDASRRPPPRRSRGSRSSRGC